MQRRMFLASTGTASITVLAGCSLDPADSYEGSNDRDTEQQGDETTQKNDHNSEVESATASSPDEHEDTRTDDESDTDSAETGDGAPESADDELDVIESEGESDDQGNANGSDEESDADGIEGNTPENSGDELDVIEDEGESDDQ